VARLAQPGQGAAAGGPGGAGARRVVCV
jgi:hypothetical protein